MERYGFSQGELEEWSDEGSIDAPPPAKNAQCSEGAAVELRLDDSTASHYDGIMMRISEHEHANRAMLHSFLGIRPTRARSSLSKAAELKRRHQSMLQSAYKHDAEDPNVYIDQDFDEWSQDARVPSVVHVINEEEVARGGSCMLGAGRLLIDAPDDSAPPDCLGIRPSRRHASVRKSKGIYENGISTKRTSVTSTMEGSNNRVLASLGCVLGSPKSHASKGEKANTTYDRKEKDYNSDSSSLENKQYWEQRATEAKALLDRL